MDFSGIWIPLVTPLRGGAVDRGALARLVQHLTSQGVAGFVACGSTGEAAMLDADEQEAVLATVIDAAAGKPVLFGLSGVRPAAVAEDSPLPLVAYDIPARTGVRIEPRTLLALAGHPRIVALKDCSGDRAAAEAVLADGRLALLAGNDDELFDQLARGAAGGITASAHLATARFVALAAALRRGDLGEARALWRVLAPITRAVFAEPNPAPLKAALARLGWLAYELRAPMQAAGDATAQALLQAAA